MLRELLRKLFPATPRDERAKGAEDDAGETGEADEDDADEADGLDPYDPFPEPVRLEIRDVLDLHAFAPRDVGRVVEEYLLEARAAGYNSVRIIHGKGVGVQREAVRKILARTPFVEHFSDAPPEAGGWGATVVRMKGEGDEV
ncbi:MAG TPA: Smr/MutS family protein [Pyrinomonadaceae bacterium]|nr:Smr/MutS family protein [Pyrinomonadaceae bacterium]